MTESKPQNIRHAREDPFPVDALLVAWPHVTDPEMRLVWLPLHDDAPGCRNEACATDAVCTCEEDRDEAA